MGVVEAINGNLKTLLRRGQGYKNLRYFLLKAQPMETTGPSIFSALKEQLGL